METPKNNLQESFIGNLKENGFVTLSYPKELRDSVEETIDSWHRFCVLPAGIRQKLPYSSSSDGVGYELKEGVGVNADRKENFDITVGGKKWLRENGHLVDGAVSEFVEKATNLVDRVKPTILDFARQSEKAFGLKGFYEEVAKSEDAFFFRFIHYFGDRTPGQEIAAPHADQSGFTLHLYESAPGLQRLTYANRWVEMPVSDGQTVIIPAMQMQLRSESKLKASIEQAVASQKRSEASHD